MKPHILAIILIITSLALATFSDATSLMLRYDRNAIFQGELWRLLTGNIVHLGWPHTVMNLAGFILIWMIFWRQLSTTRWLLAIVLTSLGVTLGLLLFNPQLHWYVGLSGSLHGLFIIGIIRHLQAGYRLEWLLLAALTTKLAWEQFVGALAGTSELAGGPVVVDAHLYGAVSGAILALVFMLQDKKASHRETN